MRISDWSSDVCSSDLVPEAVDGRGDQPPDVGRVAKIRDQDNCLTTILPNFPGNALQVRLAYVGQRDAGTGLQQSKRDRAAKATRGSGNEGGPPGDRKSTRLNSSH